MMCPRCAGEFSVTRTYSVDAVGSTQDRICLECGHRATTVVIVLHEELSAYKARRILPDLRLTREPQAREADKKG